MSHEYIGELIVRDGGDASTIAVYECDFCHALTRHWQRHQRDAHPETIHNPIVITRETGNDSGNGSADTLRSSPKFR